MGSWCPQGLFQWERIAFGSSDLWSGLCVFQFKTRSPSIIIRLFFFWGWGCLLWTHQQPSRTEITAKQVVITVIKHCHLPSDFRQSLCFRTTSLLSCLPWAFSASPYICYGGSLQFANPFCALSAVTCGFMQHLVWPGTIPVIYLLINTSHSSCNLVFSTWTCSYIFHQFSHLLHKQKFNRKHWSSSRLTSGLLTWLLPAPKSPFIAIFTRED